MSLYPKTIRPGLFLKDLKGKVRRVRGTYLLDENNYRLELYVEEAWVATYLSKMQREIYNL